MRHFDHYEQLHYCIHQAHHDNNEQVHLFL
jgi:hypothetical protein